MKQLRQTYEKHVSIDPSIDYFDCSVARKNQTWRNYNRSLWLKKYIESKNYKSLTYEDKPIHPVLVFIVVKTYFQVVWDFVLKGKWVSVPYLGDFTIRRKRERADLKEIVWSNKPHPFIKMEMNAYIMKKLMS